MTVFQKIIVFNGIFTSLSSLYVFGLFAYTGIYGEMLSFEQCAFMIVGTLFVATVFGFLPTRLCHLYFSEDYQKKVVLKYGEEKLNGVLFIINYVVFPLFFLANIFNWLLIYPKALEYYNMFF